ncbi:unnamed protein product [Rotaria sp. Silwood2]|nr:unnamed protein product [Rotaria sp. Silwood2]CAF3389184.1 unnamed protein product [Rotaria sp. Silwood2]CAF4075674.1 unnamed protein product [Rotaria sp. Silwood2]CAF4283265.1 unnamed protein product [Rotaria sp. Silwood2]
MMIENFHRQEQTKLTSPILKQHSTNNLKGNNQNDGNWETVLARRNNKRMNTENNVDYRQQAKVLPKSNQLHVSSYKNRISSSCHINQQTTNEETRIPITNDALDYASNYHFPPFKLECLSKIRDRKDGTKLINELIKFITPGFLIQNPRFSHDILIDLWWIDPDGNIQLIIKAIDLYVYLYKRDRYLNQLNNVKINPIPPTHLPPQHTVIKK